MIFDLVVKDFAFSDPRSSALISGKLLLFRPSDRQTLIAQACPCLPPNNFFWRVPHCFRALSVAPALRAARGADFLAQSATDIGYGDGWQIRTSTVQNFFAK
jgi:hypothetical protein